MNRHKVVDLVDRTRAAQGLPPTIEDPATLAQLAAILRGAADDGRRAA